MSNLWLPRRRGKEEKWTRGKPLHLQWIDNKVLLYSTGNYIQYPVINLDGKEYEKICVHLNHFALHPKLIHNTNGKFILARFTQLHAGS